MEKAFEAWKKSPTPESLGALLDKADPVIQSAITSYGSGDKSLRGEAKALAIEAFGKFDPTKGAKLNTHLMNQLQPLRRTAQAYRRIVHVPERVDNDMNKLFEAEKGFSDEYGRDPSDSELADKLGVSQKRVRHVRKFAIPTVPESAFDAKDDEDDESDNLPGVSAPDPQKIWMDYVYHDLGEIDKKILEWKTGKYGHSVLPTMEIARRLNISSGAVSQRAAKIAAKLNEGQGVEVTGGG
jgi:DNA-directed RNA polymerase specialized sigma subunit